MDIGVGGAVGWPWTGSRDGASLPALLNFHSLAAEQNQELLAHPNTRINQCLSRSPRWGHIYTSLVGKPVSRSPGIPPAGVLGIRDGNGSALGLDPPWRESPWKAAQGKASPTASPVWWRADVYLKTVWAAVQLRGIFVKMVFFICRVKWTGIIFFCCCTCGSTSHFTGKKNYKTN